MDWGAGAHASTFGGNPIACAAALETIRLLEEKYIAKRPGSVTTSAADRGWPEASIAVGHVRGKGLDDRIEPGKDKETREPHPKHVPELSTAPLRRDC
jgi:4-aminobutyrate aminotransferase